MQGTERKPAWLEYRDSQCHLARLDENLSENDLRRRSLSAKILLEVHAFGAPSVSPPQLQTAKIHKV